MATKKNKKQQGPDEINLDGVALEISEAKLKEKANSNRLKNRIANVENYLSEKYKLRNNSIKNTIEFCNKITDQCEWEEIEEANLFREFMHAGISFSVPNTLLLLKSDFVEKFNPIQHYFENLPVWDGKDTITELGKFVQAKNPERFVKHLKKHMVRSIACSLNKSVFNKHCFVLYSKQNDGKSSFIRWICPPALQQYYTEHLPLGDKDALEALASNFIINFDELARLSKFEIGQIKSIISQLTVKFRAAYERKPKLFYRICNFWGSTNSKEFLTDETGSVRWLVFEIKNIDWKSYLQHIDINQLWAQAFALYNSKFDYQLTRDEITENEQVNEEHQVNTPEFELIQDLYSPATEKEFEEPGNLMVQFKNSTGIALRLAEKYGNSIRFSSVVVGRAMKRLGYEPVKRWDGIKQTHGYYLKEKQTNTTTAQPANEMRLETATAADANDGAPF